MNALRFGDLEYARQARQECLSFYQQDGNDFGVAWATWEMSEVYRVGGDLAQAQEWLEKASLLFEKFDDPSIVIFLERSQADLDFMNGNYPEAKLHFEKSAFHAHHIVHKWALSYALCGWAKAEVELGDFGRARQHFLQAIQTAREVDEDDLVLNALAGYTKILLLTATPEKAVELGTWIINHDQCWNETKIQVKSLLSSISLPPGRLLGARERSKLLDFAEAIPWVTNFPG